MIKVLLCNRTFNTFSTSYAQILCQIPFSNYAGGRKFFSSIKTTCTKGTYKAFSCPVLLVLKGRWRVALDPPKNSNFFIGCQKMNAQQKWKLQSSTHSILLAARMAVPLLVRITKNVTQMETIPNGSKGIVKSLLNQSSASPATMSFLIVIITFYCSSQESEKRCLKLWEFNQLIHQWLCC